MARREPGDYRPLRNWLAWLIPLDEHGLLLFVRGLFATRELVLYFLFLAFGIAYLVIGHTAGRIVGACMIVVWLGVGIAFVRRRAGRRLDPPS